MTVFHADFLSCSADMKSTLPPPATPPAAGQKKKKKKEELLDDQEHIAPGLLEPKDE